MNKIYAKNSIPLLVLFLLLSVPVCRARQEVSTPTLSSIPDTTQAGPAATQTTPAETPTPRSGPLETTLGAPISLPIGGSAILPEEDLVLRFIEAVGDSRCPIHGPYPGSEEAASGGETPSQVTLTLQVSQVTEGVGENAIQIFLIILENEGQSGSRIGCGDSITPVQTPLSKTGIVLDDVKTSLETLFSIDPAAYADSDLFHSLQDWDVVVEEVIIEGDLAVIDLSGSFQLTGVCADVRNEMQILFTIFQFEEIQQARILFNGQNLKQIFDLSGLVGEEDVYTPPESE